MRQKYWSGIAAALFMICTSTILAQSPQVVINEIMYSPQSGAPEWFEIVNIGSLPVNIKGWRMSDATSSRPVITNNDYFIPSNGLVVISKDSTILTAFPEVAGSLIVANVPSLNNTGDDVAIYLPDTTLIEKISYFPSWGGATGKSLERKNQNLSGNDSNNWGTSTDLKGATPSRRNSFATLTHDVSIQSMTYDPVSPRLGENLFFTVEIKNNGAEDAYPFTLQCCDDINFDDVIDTNELVFAIDAAQPLQSGQTVRLNGNVTPTLSTNRRFIFLLEYTADENKNDNRKVVTIQYGVTKGSVVINEIMYAPVGGEPEWIELFNTTDQTVSIRDWEIADNSTRVIITDGDSTIPPKDFVVISKSNSINNYHTKIPSSIIVTNIPALNNAGDEVRLFDSRGFTIDSIRYLPEWGGAVNGVSLERIDPFSNSNSQSNWSSSNDNERSTPGRVNSIGILDYDAAISSVSTDVKDVHAVIKNIGLQTMTNINVNIFYDSNGDSVATENERLAPSKIILSLSKNDSVNVIFIGADTVEGTHALIARIDAANDQKIKNNIRVQKIVRGTEKGTLAINEIMFAPNANEAEYIEFINLSKRELNIQDWKFADQAGTGSRTVHTLSIQALVLHPDRYLVVSSDSSILKRFEYLKTSAANRMLLVLNLSSLNLNNDVDEIVLIDPLENTIDSVRYDATWHNPNITTTTGISLERINPKFSSNDSRNWNSSASKLGGTPGLRNSIYTESPPNANQNGNASITFTPNPFSPDGEGFEDFTIMKWNLPASVSQVRIRVYDTQGRLVRTIANNIPSGSNGELIWDGLDDEKQRLRIGMYVVLLEGIDIYNNVVTAVKGVVVIASKL